MGAIVTRTAATIIDLSAETCEGTSALLAFLDKTTIRTVL
jgi:hypothetical protein